MLLSVTPSADATNPLILCILIALFVVFVASHNYIDSGGPGGHLSQAEENESVSVNASCRLDQAVNSHVHE